MRQLHRDHQYSHYVSAILQYAKAFTVEFSSYCQYISVDDKAIIPVGEPDCLVASVAFFVTTPEQSCDSFFDGQAFVTLKDKVTQPSSALHHATELTELIQINYPSVKPVMVLVSDGGPDHHLTFKSVQVANLCMFMALDLDMLVCVRTCPYQSWQNIAERVMSTLNFDLQNVSLARSSMTEPFESLVRNKNTMQNIRDAIQKKSELGGAIRDSMVHTKIVLGDRFQSMKIKGMGIKLGLPAQDDDIDELFSQSTFIEPNLDRNKLRKEDLKDAKSLHSFFSKHCHCSHYVFQIRKCTDESCYYCSKHPPRLPKEVFEKLSFLPLPLSDRSKEHYQKFSDLFRKPPDCSDRPSCELTVSDEAKKKDKDYRSTLVKAKVRAIISCEECKKPRCIYANSRLSSQEEVCVKRMKEAKTYICGSPLFPDGSRSPSVWSANGDSVLYFCVGAFSSSLFLLRSRRRDPC